MGIGGEEGEEGRRGGGEEGKGGGGDEGRRGGVKKGEREKGRKRKGGRGEYLYSPVPERHHGIFVGLGMGVCL